MLVFSELLSHLWW